MSNSKLLRLWTWPVAMALLSASGLISALVSEALGDVWSWLALGLPVAVMAWFGLRRPRSRVQAADSRRDRSSTLSSHP